METSVIIAGFGGQGVLFAGKILAYAGMAMGQHVTWIPSYGPEMRGGTANCTVILSDTPIGAPIVARPDIAIVLNNPSFEKYEPKVRPGGLLLVNSSIVTARSERQDIELATVPANALAEEFGSSKMLNVAVLGALLCRRPILPLSVVEEVLGHQLEGNRSELLQGNLRVLRRGYAFAGTVDARP